MEYSSAVFIKTLKVELFHRDFANFGLYKEFPKKVKEKKNSYMQLFLSGSAFQYSSHIFQKNQFSKKQKFKHTYVRSQL